MTAMISGSSKDGGAELPTLCGYNRILAEVTSLSFRTIREDGLPVTLRDRAPEVQSKTFST
ncbi:MAG: hypothetical protein BMS9Abin05_2749 [Rhodothermia bacterium]|nr:MAG: hypothetical protein BMS9Abin05_2749 [Rhodothermia bacterium]